jgi:hypothetical protein
MADMCFHSHTHPQWIDLLLCLGWHKMLIYYLSLSASFLTLQSTPRFFLFFFLSTQKAPSHTERKMLSSIEVKWPYTIRMQTFCHSNRKASHTLGEGPQGLPQFSGLHPWARGYHPQDRGCHWSNTSPIFNRVIRKVMPCWAWVAPLIWCFIPSWLFSAKSWNFIK